MPMRFSLFSLLLGVIAALLFMALVALVAILAGGYNVAADDRHQTLVEWALTTTMRQSVQRRAANLDPPAFTPQMIAAGAGEYKAMCQHCHGGMAVANEKWARGIRPKPPALAAVADRWQPREIYWIVKHGIRMTAMPSFGGTHSDEALWSIAAFVHALPTMSAEQYAAFPAEQESGEHGHGGE